MQTISATELARNTSKILDRVTSRGESIAVERNGTVIVQIIASAPTMTAAQAFSGLEPGLSPKQAAAWLRDSKEALDEGFDPAVRDPWA